MTKRRLLCWSLILVILAAFAVWLEPTRVVWGWLRGEAFYDGRPTSYWERVLTNWDELYLDTCDDNWFDLDESKADSLSIISGSLVERHRDVLRIRGILTIRSHKNNWIATVRRRFAESANRLEVNSLETDLLIGDPQAAPVLRALAEHAVSEVRSLAEYGLRNIDNQSKQGP